MTYLRNKLLSNLEKQEKNTTLRPVFKNQYKVQLIKRIKENKNDRRNKRTR